ncbi:BON domain-containing protein [Chitinophaga nivalis]|uniref:BON domain-containing protein n=1 Tax=Chitinophaga nivalis TaxID=2991709 RepID=A0ABT3IR12_9BACT|nr:BON domain-containing protein [Chitinophaga nivalis]MCW3463989.1 BON domain-containing protein [Chitinophaga nivalis]MCW3486321.1 BON domain-containing protein [Chitinophaga nivalis]
MKMKKLTAAVLIAGLAFMVACKGKPKDSDIQAAVTTSLQATPQVAVDVKEGVVTLSGEVSSEAEKASVEAAAKSVKDVKTVANNITVAVAPVTTAPVATTPDDALTTAVAGVVKDFPGVSATVKDGVVSVAGELNAARWKTLKIALDALKPKKVDASGLKVK